LIERVGVARDGLGVEQPLFDQLHVARQIAHHVQAALLARVEGLAGDAEERRGEGYFALLPNAMRNDVAAHAHHLPTLADGQTAGGVGTDFDSGSKLIAAHGLDHEVGADAAAYGCAAREFAKRARLAEVANFRHQIVALHVGIEREGRAHL